MGYWAKDGSYQYDENDLKNREKMNETQGQAYERQQKGLAAMKAYEEEEYYIQLYGRRKSYCRRGRYTVRRGYRHRAVGVLPTGKLQV